MTTALKCSSTHCTLKVGGSRGREEGGAIEATWRGWIRVGRRTAAAMLEPKEAPHLHDLPGKRRAGGCGWHPRPWIPTDLTGCVHAGVERKMEGTLRDG